MRWPKEIEHGRIIDYILDDLNIEGKRWPSNTNIPDSYQGTACRIFYAQNNEHLVVLNYYKSELSHSVNEELLNDSSNLIYNYWVKKFIVDLHDPDSIDDFKIHMRAFL